MSSLTRTATGSSVRRRSGGSSAYIPADIDLFPSARSQPALSHRRVEGSTIPSARSDTSRRLSINLLSAEDRQGYYQYSTLSLEDMSPSDHSGESRFVNDNSTTSGHDMRSTSVNNATESTTGPHSSADEELPLNIVRRNVRPVDVLSPTLDDFSIETEPASPTPTLTAFDASYGHPGLIPYIGTTTNKFTRKWPRPKSVSPFDQSKGVKGEDAGSVASNDSGGQSLEEGGRFNLAYLYKWTPFKWCLFLSVICVFACGCGGLIVAFMTWFNAWNKANVMLIADHDILVLITLASCALIFTSLIGLSGTLLNSRPLLAIYAILLWPTLVTLLSVGYKSYRRAHHNLDYKLSGGWSREFSVSGRRLIQDALQCCGYFSSQHEASPSKRCYLRTPLPGCKDKFFDFEKENLGAVWRSAFALVPIHLVNMVIALLCANHSTNMFGKRIMPKQYRLDPNDVHSDAEKLLGAPFTSLASPASTAHNEEKAGVREKIDKL